MSATSNGRAGEEPARARTSRRKNDLLRDRHVLYEAAVQSPGEDVTFVERTFRRLRGRPARTLREDFCGTAAFASTWVKQHPENRAWGVDIDRATLDWGRDHHVARLGDAGRRVTLVCGDVLTARTPKTDIVCAFNFSYWLFTERPKMLQYFRRIRRMLAPDGLFLLDVYGGQEAMGAERERRRIQGEVAPDGRKIPSFTYVWDQASFNIVDHSMTCHIHFDLGRGTKLKKAFSYKWRVWTVPEIRDLLADAGFSSSEVYLEGWDDRSDEADGIFRRRKTAENQAGWVGYVIGLV